MWVFVEIISCFRRRSDKWQALLEGDTSLCTLFSRHLPELRHPGPMVYTCSTRENHASPGFPQHPYHVNHDAENQLASELFCRSCFAQAPMLMLLCLVCDFFKMRTIFPPPGGHSSTETCCQTTVVSYQQNSLLSAKPWMLRLYHIPRDSFSLAREKGRARGYRQESWGDFCRRQFSFFFLILKRVSIPESQKESYDCVSRCYLPFPPL